eukprot:scaffold20819_cov108-Isochrysis_galbana.AAC.2
MRKQETSRNCTRPAAARCRVGAACCCWWCCSRRHSSSLAHTSSLRAVVRPRKAVLSQNSSGPSTKLGGQCPAPAQCIRPKAGHCGTQGPGLDTGPPP